MTVNEQIVTGRKFRKLVDEATKLWQRISFWTKASDVEFDDGSTAETKMGAINGITDSLASTSSNIAASAKALSQLNNNLMSMPQWITDADGKITGYKTQGGADTVYPFSQLNEEALVFISPQLRGSANKGQTMHQDYNVYVEKNRKYLFVYYQTSGQNFTVTVSKDSTAKTIQMNRNPTINNISTGIYEATETGQVTVTVATKFSSDLTIYYAILLAFA